MEKQQTRSDLGLEPAKQLVKNRLCVAYGRTGVGGRSENQDAFGGFGSGNVVLTVCDGMGGMNGGQTASRIAKTEILQTFYECPSDKWNQQLIVTAVNNANNAIYRKSLAEPTLRGMGTTATVLLLTPEAAFLTHIGDSRIYQLRGGKKIFRTFDHSKVFEMVAQNMMTEEQARNSSFSNVITRALGIRPTVEMTVEKLPYRKGDRFVLCCDGIWNCLPEPEVIGMFCEKNESLDEVNFLTESVNAIGIEKGEGHDNLTAIIADTLHNSEYQYGILQRLKKWWHDMFTGKESAKSAPKVSKTRS